MGDDLRPLKLPDASRAQLDRVIGELVTSAQEVLATQGRLRSLLEASRLVASELELPVVLRRIVEAAVELVGAKYGAIGIVAPDGTLSQFLHVGMSDDLVAQIGHLPEGHGILGALIREQEPIRLEHLRGDPRSSGVPAGHPPMDSFLGVPVRVRGQVYGNLYLSEHPAGGFSEEDQELLIALAGTAGAAIDHARLFDESRRRQRWATASAEVTAALLSEHAEDSLAILADRVAGLADADLVCIALPTTGSTMIIDIARGELASSFAGTTFNAKGTLVGRAHSSGQPVLSDVDGMNRVGPPLNLGPTMAVPFTSTNAPTGVLTVSRLSGRAGFTRADLEMAADFAAQASVALRLDSVRADRARLAMFEDRARIARDLHDNVIQRLFGAGLSLQAVAGSITDPSVQARIGQQVDALDSAIAEIRTAIFTLTALPAPDAPKLRHRVIDVLTEMADLFEQTPRLTFSGAVDLMVNPVLADDVIAVVREGLSNVARHAAATTTVVSIGVTAEQVSVHIVDDGRGIHSPERSSGTHNLEARAAARGGRFALTSAATGGTELIWEVPLEGATP